MINWVTVVLLKLIRLFTPYSKMVAVESPYAGDVEYNKAYARLAMRDCLERGEIPYASHLLYTQDNVLDDTIPQERLKGIESGFAWAAIAPKRVYYEDLGRSGGMVMSLEEARKYKQKIEIRYIYKDEHN